MVGFEGSPDYQWLLFWDICYVTQGFRLCRYLKIIWLPVYRKPQCPPQTILPQYFLEPLYLSPNLPIMVLFFLHLVETVPIPSSLWSFGLLSSPCQAVTLDDKGFSLSSLTVWPRLPWGTAVVSHPTTTPPSLHQTFYLERPFMNYNWFQTIMKIRFLFSKYLLSLFPEQLLETWKRLRKNFSRIKQNYLFFHSSSFLPLPFLLHWFN